MASIVVGDAVPESQEQGTARARAVSAIQRQGALIALVALVIFGVVRYGSSFYSVYNIFDAFLNNNTYYALIALGLWTAFEGFATDGAFLRAFGRGQRRAIAAARPTVDSNE